MQNPSNNLRLIWAEKIVLWLAVLSAGLAAFAWLMVAIGAGPMGANHVIASIGTNGMLEIGALMLALWATFRALDFVAHGSTYRLFHAASSSDTPALPTGNNLLAH